MGDAYFVGRGRYLNRKIDTDEYIASGEGM
jgi:hypothetical protein